VGIPHPSAPCAREKRRPCPSWPEQLPPARSTGQLAGAVTTATAAGGPGAWRTPAALPFPRPLPSGGVHRGGGRGDKSPPHPHPLPGRRGHACRAHSGPPAWVWGSPCLVLPGRTAAAAQCLRLAPFSSRQVCGSRAGRPLPLRALGGRGRVPPASPGTSPPAPALTWMYAIFARALTPARAWRRHGHFALADRGGGRQQWGKGSKRPPGGPRRDWRG
jgi:hypothetical protein